MLLPVDEAPSGRSHIPGRMGSGPEFFRSRFGGIAPGVDGNDAAAGAIESAGERSLQSILEDGNLPPYDAVRVTLQICEFLQSARTRGDQHGRLSTDNVFLDREGRARIGDCGRIARSNSEAAEIEALGLLLNRMLTQASSIREAWNSRTSTRLRQIVHRALGCDSPNGYGTLREFVRDLEREERVHFLKALMIPISLLGALLVVGSLLGQLVRG
jgi:hypothetical protein